MIWCDRDLCAPSSALHWRGNVALISNLLPFSISSNMSNWLDLISFVVGLALFIGVVIGVIYVARVTSNAIDETKKSLNERGVDVSASGISVKTRKHMTREDYLDATQRNIVKAIQTTSSPLDQAEFHHRK
ncbi:hypothetical protein BDM02DRAFT_1431731 [Thelephora ganbajun]|uniref:Uncharacterized protein n=1 Tax=Thelephora ganbajun TaxID=370292 RepID=A0ACB6ZLL2_THEGA|nr:hypothetical protein BDM02DRAFT_1431731 [Thelephora ganbajun]